MDPAIAVTDAAARERYEITVDGELAGFTQYRRRPALIAFVHTEIDASARRPSRRRRSARAARA